MDDLGTDFDSIANFVLETAMNESFDAIIDNLRHIESYVVKHLNVLEYSNENIKNLIETKQLRLIYDPQEQTIEYVLNGKSILQARVVVSMKTNIQFGTIFETIISPDLRTDNNETTHEDFSKYYQRNCHYEDIVKEMLFGDY